MAAQMGKSGSAAVSGMTSGGCCAQRRLNARLRKSSSGTASSEKGRLAMLRRMMLTLDQPQPALGYFSLAFYKNQPHSINSWGSGLYVFPRLERFLSCFWLRVVACRTRDKPDDRKRAPAVMNDDAVLASFR